MANAAHIAKATLQRLASSRLEPTPENYLKAWIESGGIAVGSPARAAADGSGGANWGGLIEQIVRGLERGGRQWTIARKKEGVQRVLASSRADANRLRERLLQLVASWERDGHDAPVELHAEADAAPSGAVEADLVATVRAGLPGDDSQARALDAVLAARVEPAITAQVRGVFARRHRLTTELARLVREMTDSMVELAEDESWAQGQAQSLREHLGSVDQAPSVRGVRAAGALLVQARRSQQGLKAERDRAREALRTLVASLVAELDALGGPSGPTRRLGDELERYTERLEQTPGPAALAALVHDMLASTRTAQADVADASARIVAGQAQAQSLATRVAELEGELKRLSDEASTDSLTQVANRRGLQAAFERESARAERDGSALAIGLIDLDNFKKLNDSLGHAAGDEALKTLAARACATLRPIDHVARFGGEEFVVLLPGTGVDAAREALARLQRTLSMSLFLHEGREVFVTFSAGVTAWRVGEALDEAIERADAALFEAKRSGKNRTAAA
ncbi:MAG TPA: diguanylate cyclase [Burkholderiaceae bacterium]|nr:diguanylate cyclase [Burkholderiaceae bacterium]